MSENDFVRWWLETEFGSKKEFQDKKYIGMEKRPRRYGSILIRLQTKRLAGQRLCVNAALLFLFTQAIAEQGILL
jgi:hypothetical protein